MSFLTSLFVGSRKSVSCGDILWKTTFWIDDLPARRAPIKSTRGVEGPSWRADAIGGRAFATARGVPERLAMRVRRAVQKEFYLRMT